jgi:HAD superfamily hydrolase (TIGR01662 family)
MWIFKRNKAILNQNFKCVLFDLGRTLLYFRGDSHEVFNIGKIRLSSYLKVELPDLDRARFLDDFDQRIKEYYSERDESYIEHTTFKILKQSLEDLGYNNISPGLLIRALERMYSISETRWRPAEDTHSCLRTLRKQGYCLGIISNAGDANNANRLIDRWRLRHYMDFVIISAEIGIRKPAPTIFQLALDNIGVSPEEAVMVGDTLRADIKGAQALGIAAVWITRQADTDQNAADLATIVPDATIKKLHELPPLLDNWKGDS